HSLGERQPGRRWDEQPRLDRAGRSEVVERATPRLRHHDHARPAAERSIVDGAVYVVGPRPKIVDAQVDVAARDRLAEQRLPQRRQVFGEDRDDVDPHRSSSPSGGSTTTRPPATSTDGTIAATNGMRRSRPPTSTTR